jgi:hypothetical protein
MGASNRFPIDVTAQDKFSAVFDRLNKVAGKAIRPLADVGKSVERAGKAAGFDKVAGGIAKIGGVAVDAGKKLGALNGPMAFLGSAGTIAGIAAMADQWARAGLTLQNTAAAAGLSASNLMGVRSAAELVGVGGDAAASAMNNLGTTLHEAVYGRNPEALAMLNQLGVGLHRTKTGAVDSKQALYDLADAIARQKDAQTQNFVARMFGIEDLLPAIRDGGSAALKQLEEFGRRSGAVMDEQGTKKADEFGLSLQRLKSAVSGIGNAIELEMIPKMQPVIDKLTKWIVGNRDTAATVTEIGGAAAIAAGGIATLTGALSGLGAVAGIAALGGIGLAAAAAAGAIALLTKKSGEAAGDSIKTQLENSDYFVDPYTGATIPVPKNAGGAAGAPGAVPSISSPPQSNAGVPLGMRQNNPLNLRKWGSAPIAGGYAAFGSEEEGLEAGAKQLLLYGDRGKDTINSIVPTFAPASDRNNVEAYEGDLEKRTGFGGDEHLNMRDPAILAKLEAAMGHHEQGRDVASADAIGRAVAAAIAEHGAGHLEVTLKGLPPGAQASVRDTRSGAFLPTRVEYSMPGATP